MHKSIKILVLLVAMCNFTYSLNAYAANDTSPFWINLRPKLEDYLKKSVNTQIYRYQILGPSVPMKKFLGNVPNAPVIFRGYNSHSKRHIQSIIARSKNGKDMITINVKFWKYRGVLVVTKNHQAGEIIHEADIKRERRAILESEWFNYLDPPLGRVTANQNIQAGTALRINSVSQKKIIQSGDFVRLIKESSVLKLEFRCQAITSGVIGDTITLKCPDIKKPSIKAVVEDFGLARLL
ncbi:MAG: flagellar basal body P-ring formation chaperone FlgA [Candidatus Caenarcaniphilales bacterium]|nr:flagellar basal body P-ring formation chaperone FlgA [Candidatus Caenarcaniphilales bacterium]